MREPSPRERDVLLRLAAFRFLSASQIACFLFEDSSLSPASRRVVTWRVLARLRSRTLVAWMPRRFPGAVDESSPGAYYLTLAGQRLARMLDPAVPLRRYRPPATFQLRRGLLDGAIALAFRRAARTNEGHELLLWECDWELAPRVEGLVAPDAYLCYEIAGQILHAFLEVDMGNWQTSAFRRRLGHHLDLYRSGTWEKGLPFWPDILVVTETDFRAGQLRDVTGELLDAELPWLTQVPRLLFAAAADVFSPIGPLGGIWQMVGRPGLHTLMPVDAQADASARQERPMILTCECCRLPKGA